MGGARRRVGATVALVALLVASVGCGDVEKPVAGRQVASIGFLSVSASPASIEALRDGLADLGYRDSDTMRLDVRVTDDEAELARIAAEFVAADVDLIIAGGTKAIEAARDATASLPIVMTNSGDPVGAGLVDSLAVPGGNITGLTQSSPQLAPKRLELLHEAFPGLTTVAVVFNPDHPTTQRAVEELQGAAPALGLGLGLGLIVTPVTEGAMTDAIIAGAKADGAGALVVLRDPLTISTARHMAAAADAARLPAIYETRNFIDDGGLMLYGPDLADLFRRSAGYGEERNDGQGELTEHRIVTRAIGLIQRS